MNNKGHEYKGHEQNPPAICHNWKLQNGTENYTYNFIQYLTPNMKKLFAQIICCCFFASAALSQTIWKAATSSSIIIHRRNMALRKPISRFYRMKRASCILGIREAWLNLTARSGGFTLCQMGQRPVPWQMVKEEKCMWGGQGRHWLFSARFCGQIDLPQFGRLFTKRQKRFF